jgi:hypothetical protein
MKTRILVPGIQNALELTYYNDLILEADLIGSYGKILPKIDGIIPSFRLNRVHKQLRTQSESKSNMCK